MEVTRAAVVPVEQDVIIRLSNREARILQTVLYGIGGNVNPRLLISLRNRLFDFGINNSPASYTTTTNSLYVNIKE